MVIKSTDHGNDAMVAQFVFSFLCSPFREKEKNVSVTEKRSTIVFPRTTLFSTIGMTSKSLKLGGNSGGDNCLLHLSLKHFGTFMVNKNTGHGKFLLTFVTAHPHQNFVTCTGHGTFVLTFVTAHPHQNVFTCTHAPWCSKLFSVN